MDSKLVVALIAFVVCQVTCQQQGNNPNQPFQGWFGQGGDAWQEYLNNAQQATNQFYQQWANSTGFATGGFLPGLNQQQSGANPPSSPLQGFFSPPNIPTGSFPAGQKPGGRLLTLQQDPNAGTHPQQQVPIMRRVPLVQQQHHINNRGQ